MMKRIVGFKIFESLQSITKEQKRFLDRCTAGKWSLNENGFVDIDGTFDCYGMRLEDLKGISFGYVSGSFIINHNNLTTLKGAPRKVGVDFECRNNQITSLEESPIEVGGNFYCGNNPLESLKGAPNTINGDFSCHGSDLLTLDGAPKTVGGDFWCRHNKLTTLKGSPESVGGIFSCSDNPLMTLEGAPININGEFYSDDLKIPSKKWGFQEFLRIFIEGNEKQKELVAPLVSPELINRNLEKDPEGTMVKLNSVWNSTGFKEIRSKLKIPNHLKGEMDLLGDLGEIGL